MVGKILFNGVNKFIKQLIDWIRYRIFKYYLKICVNWLALCLLPKYGDSTHKNVLKVYDLIFKKIVVFLFRKIIQNLKNKLFIFCQDCSHIINLQTFKLKNSVIKFFNNIFLLLDPKFSIFYML